MQSSKIDRTVTHKYAKTLTSLSGKSPTETFTCKSVPGNRGVQKITAKIFVMVLFRTFCALFFLQVSSVMPKSYQNRSRNICSDPPPWYDTSALTTIQSFQPLYTNKAFKRK